MSDFTSRLQELLFVAADWLQDPRRIAELVGLAVTAGVSWMLVLAARRHLARIELREGSRSHRVLHSIVEDVLFPGLFSALAGTAALVLPSFGMPGTLARALAVVALALLVVRLLVNGLRQLSGPGPLLAASGSLVVWIAWPVTALLLLGWLEPALQALDSIAITLAGARFSLRDVLQTLVTVMVFVVAAAYAGGMIERRLMAADQVPIGVRVGVAKATRLVLITVAVLLAFNLLGVDLGGLAVFSGALGVGIGFGLQRIASNFVSGFILIGDRSIRPGDVITIGERFGVVRELRARYVVVRDRDGVDTLIPNENIITSEVINWSYADRAIRLTMPVQISYQDDPRRALELMTAAAEAHPRVERSPPPVGRVTGFGESGVDLALRYWIRDPEDGINNIRSDLYLAIWDAFKEAGISIPYPQHDVHVRMADMAPGRGDASRS
jgi:small-conductance mechanosensitive channel